MTIIDGRATEGSKEGFDSVTIIGYRREWEESEASHGKEGFGIQA